MKITKKNLEKLIKEEISKMVNEATYEGTLLANSEQTAKNVRDIMKKREEESVYIFHTFQMVRELVHLLTKDEEDPGL